MSCVSVGVVWVMERVGVARAREETMKTNEEKEVWEFGFVFFSLEGVGVCVCVGCVGVACVVCVCVPSR